MSIHEFDVAKQIQTFDESDRGRYQQLHGHIRQKELVQKTRRPAQIHDALAKYEWCDRISQNSTSTLMHSQRNHDKLETTNSGFLDRIKRLRYSMEFSRVRPRPPLKSIKLLPEPMMAQLNKCNQSATKPYQSPGSGPIFEEFFVVGSSLSEFGLVADNDKLIRSREARPEVLFRYGLSKCLAMDPAQIAMFVCPTGRVQIRIASEGDTSTGGDTFVFATQLTTPIDQSLVQIFGVCIAEYESVTIVQPRTGRQVQLKTDVRYCLTTRYPSLACQFDFLQTLIVAQRHHRLGDSLVRIAGPNLSRTLVNEWAHGGASGILRRLGRRSMPDPGKTVHMDFGPRLEGIQLRRASNESIRSWTSRKVLKETTSKYLMPLIEAVLRETSIVIVGEDLGLISAWALYLTAVIFPLRWVGIALPILPDGWHDFLQSPVPIIAAVRFVPDSMLWHSNLIVWRPESNQIWAECLPPLTDTGRQYHERIVPWLERGCERAPGAGGLQRIDSHISHYISDIIRLSVTDSLYHQYRQTQMMTHYIQQQADHS